MGKHRATALAVYNERFGDIEGNREVFYDMDEHFIDEETGLPYYDYLPGLYYEDAQAHYFVNVWLGHPSYEQPIVVPESCPLNKNKIHFIRMERGTGNTLSYIWDDGH